MIAIIDYGLGNVKAITYVYKKLNIPATLIKNAKELEFADKVILPGVGAFDHAMKRLDASDMRQALEKMVIDRHIPILGICVGMQMLANRSEEGSVPGLGWLNGEVKRFIPVFNGRPLRVPHMGWNTIRKTRNSALLENLGDDARFYFLHSYYFCSHKSEDILAVTAYGEEFACMVNSDNIYGVQFHPEKSHLWGIQLLKNFAAL